MTIKIKTLDKDDVKKYITLRKEQWFRRELKDIEYMFEFEKKLMNALEEI